jgi:hypothetical protein
MLVTIKPIPQAEAIKASFKDFLLERQQRLIKRGFQEFGKASNAIELIQRFVPRTAT